MLRKRLPDYESMSHVHHGRFHEYRSFEIYSIHNEKWLYHLITHGPFIVVIKPFG